MTGNGELVENDRKIAVFGATGHTGAFVGAELASRGYAPVLVGRDAGRLEAAGRMLGAETRLGTIEDVASLERAFDGVAAVINCAGPFLDTAPPVIEAALRTGVHYLDVTAEQRSVLDTFEHHGEAARERGIVVLPAMGFYGGLADLLASAIGDGLAAIDRIRVAVVLDRWWPTPGTRRTGERNTFKRCVVEGGRLAPLPDPAPTARMDFPQPFGEQEMLAVPFSEIVTLSSHLPASSIHSYINVASLQDIRDARTPPPVATDASGRSPQQFLMEVVVDGAGETRRATARGRDIYAVSAPLVVEAAARIIDGRARCAGVAAAGALFDARDFLAALSPDPLAVEFHGGS